MKGDYHRYLAEFKTADERKVAAENTLNAYKAAQFLLSSRPRLGIFPKNHAFRRRSLRKLGMTPPILLLALPSETGRVFLSIQSHTVQHIGDFSFPRLADFGAAISAGNKLQCQQVLEELDVYKRLKLTLELVKKEMEICKIQELIAKAIEEKISGEQPQYLLNET